MELRSFDFSCPEQVTAAQIRVDAGIESLLKEIVEAGTQVRGSGEEIHRTARGLKAALESLKTLQETREL